MKGPKYFFLLHIPLPHICSTDTPLSHLVVRQVHRPGVLRQPREPVEPGPHAAHLHRVDSLGLAGDGTLLHLGQEAGAAVAVGAGRLHVAHVVLHQEEQRPLLVRCGIVAAPGTVREKIERLNPEILNKNQSGYF